MSYQVFAQKYRPQTFDDVIGQEAATRTLKNSVIRGRLANAYIFCGPRGVGKTSVARLLSKTLNCEMPPEKSPCNLCSSCREISQGNNIDVLEIDGASNRGIDEIRALRENVKFSPSKGKYKVYIIDEVHMLTQEAFNALLKTLEEPPAHVKFVFATTAPHKVLPTIMSRCQRFDFKKIPPKMIYDRVMDIAKKEKIDIDEKAALLISRSADGSLRDSLVILDQMVSFSGKKILPDDVIELLGMVHKDRIFELSDAVIDNDPGRVTRILDELINSGKDPVFVTNGLISHYRDLMILKTTGAPTSDMAFAADELEKLTQQLGKLSLEEILYILQNLSHCLTLMKGTMF
ncbi:DNA polymerase III subunit gamma/tau, partial [Candidatus Omnitrophota bacterium]